MGDITDIRANTFKQSTIVHAIQKSGIWPIEKEQVLYQLQRLSAPQQTNPTEVSPPATLTYNKQSYSSRVETRIPLLLSSPSRQRYTTFITDEEHVLARALLTEQELMLTHTREKEQLKRRCTSRRTLQKGGHLSVIEGRDKIDGKTELAGVAARKAERQRKKQVADFHRTGIDIPEELQNPIEDPEALAQAQDESDSQNNRQCDRESEQQSDRE